MVYGKGQFITVGADLPPVATSGGGMESGCKYLDLLFVIDISGSMSEEKAKALGYTPLAAFASWNYSAVDPADQLLMGPALAIPAALDRAGMDRIRDAFGRNVSVFESVWYGTHQATAQTIDTFIANQKTIGQMTDISTTAYKVVLKFISKEMNSWADRGK